MTFDRLTACGDIATTSRAVRARDSSIISNCRPPNSALERGLYDRTAPPYRQNLCFLRAPPAPFLNGFGCASFRYPEGPDTDLLCMRMRSDIDVAEYRRNYETRYAARVRSYLADAARCPASNGDSSVLAQGPGNLDLIARYELGFMLSLGQGDTTDSYVMHGFAVPDPTLNSGAGVVEIVYLVVTARPGLSGRPIVDEARNAIGGAWLLTVDDARDTERETNAALEQQGAPLYYDMTNYEVKRLGSAPADNRDRRQVLASWERALRTRLEDEGFEYVSDARLRAETGSGYAEMRRQLTSGPQAPFGSRQNIERMVGDEMHILINEDIACAYDGLMMAMIVGMNSTTRSPLDYGDVGVIIAGVGACSSPSRNTERFVERAKRAMNEEMRSILEREQ